MTSAEEMRSIAEVCDNICIDFDVDSAIAVGVSREVALCRIFEVALGLEEQALVRAGWLPRPRLNFSERSPYDA